MVIFNVALPWNCSKSGEFFLVEDIHHEDLEKSPTFSEWEFSDYDPHLCLCLNKYKEEIRARQVPLDDYKD